MMKCSVFFGLPSKRVGAGSYLASGAKIHAPAYPAIVCNHGVQEWIVA